MDDMHNDRRDNPDTDHSRHTGHAVGEAVTGVSGVIVGAAVGSLAGPIGTVVGGIAGAVGGWWAGRAVADAAEEYTLDDEAVYRNHYDNSPVRLADRKFDAARPAKALHVREVHTPIDPLVGPRERGEGIPRFERLAGHTVREAVGQVAKYRLSRSPVLERDL